MKPTREQLHAAGSSPGVGDPGTRARRPPLPLERRGHGPPVVLVHGAAPATAWGGLPHRLAEDHEVVTYARRGFPPNDDLGLAQSLARHTDDLEGILEHTGPASVVGWSSGGVIALDLAIRRADLVTGLVLIEPPLHAKRHPTLGQLRAVAGALVHGRSDPERGARRFLDWALGRADGRPSDVRHLDPDALRLAAPAIVDEVSHATGEREISRSALTKLEVDVEWLVGARSATGAARLAARAARRSRRITVREVGGAAHFIALDAPGAVVAAVAAVEAAKRRSAR